jgi:predicted aspartyl protease
VPVSVGSIVNGHPYIEILVSPDGKKAAQQTALVDTGFSGFISIPVESAQLMGLWAHATALYTLANGKVSDPVPLANGFASLAGDAFVPGLFSISESASVVLGMDFLVRCGQVLIIAPSGVATIDVVEYKKWSASWNALP